MTRSRIQTASTFNWAVKHAWHTMLHTCYKQTIGKQNVGANKQTVKLHHGARSTSTYHHVYMNFPQIVVHLQTTLVLVMWDATPGQKHCLHVI